MTRPRTHHVDDTTPMQALIGSGADAGARCPASHVRESTIVGGMVAGLDRGTAAEFSFFLAMPTLAATFLLHSAMGVRHHITADRSVRPLTIGFVMAFIASAAVVNRFCRNAAGGFAPLPGTASSWAAGFRSRSGWLDGVMLQWVRRVSSPGFFVTVPLFITRFLRSSGCSALSTA